MKIKLNKDIIIAGVFLIGTTVYVMQALKLPIPFKHGEPGPAFYPLVLVIIMYAASLKILVQGFKKEKKLTLTLGKNIKKPIMTIGVTAFYIGMFAIIGYWVSTILYSFSIALLFEYGKRSNTRTLIFSAIVAIVITVIGWLFFEVFFGLRLPRGAW